MTKRLWRGYDNPDAVGCIVAPLCQIKDWVEAFNTDGVMTFDKVGSVHMIAIDAQGNKANNLGLDDLAKKDNKYKIGRKLNDEDNSVFMLSGDSNNKPLIICEGLGDALALHKLYNCYIMTPIGVIGKLAKHSREIVEFLTQFCSSEIWLMPDNDAGSNLLSRFVQQLKDAGSDILIKSWLLKEKLDTLDPADVVMYNSERKAREIFERNLVIEASESVEIGDKEVLELML